MPFSFNKLWSLLSAKNMSKEELRSKIGASQTTIVNLGKNKNVSLDVVDRICEILNCVPEDIFEYIPESQPIPHQQIILKKGDVFLANIFIDGNDSNKPRPVLIYQSDNSLKYTQTIMVIPFSSRHPINNRLDVIEIPSIYDTPYLPKGGVLDLSKLTSIRRISLMQKIGTLPLDILKNVDLALSELFGTGNL